VGLLIATAAAFAITERLKLVKSPIYATYVSKTISPVCGCAHGKATIRVRLRRGDDLTVTIRDAGGNTVATLALGAHTPRGRAVFTWDGRIAAGGRAPDGTYRPEIHLAQQHRTILLPNRIVVDTHPPKVLDVKVSRATISPDGDNVGDRILVSYRLNSPAHAILYLHGRRLVRTRSHQPSGRFTWSGIVDGEPLRAGTYTLHLGGIDLAGNVTPAKARRPIVVRVRYIQLARRVIRVRRPGVRIGVRVDTDAPKYSWRLDGNHGLSKGRVLRVHVPAHAGVYALTVTERGHTDRAEVIVRAGR